MNKILFSTALFIFLLGSSFTDLKAQDSGFGIGIIVGEPTGISMKKWVSGVGAVDGAVSWSLSNDWFLLQADYVRHAFNAIPVSKGKLPLYYGLGGYLAFGDELGLGARIPLGINYIFGDVPLDIFAELVPTLNLAPNTDFSLGGGVGVRYFIR